MQILITGGGGFIATNLIIELHRIGLHREQIVVVDRAFPFQAVTRGMCEAFYANLEDSDVLATFLSSRNITHVFHLAANSDIRASADDPALEVRDTFSTTSSLVTALLRNNIFLERLVFASSSAVFGDAREAISKTTPKSPISTYGWMKLSSESLLRTASGSIARRTAIYRFPNVVGRFSTHGVILDLCKQVLEEPRTLLVLGDGKQSKPYLLASELVSVLVSKECGYGMVAGVEDFNIGPNDTASVSFIAETVITLLNPQLKIAYGDTPWGWKGDVPNYQFSKDPKLMVDFSSSKQAVETAAKEVIEQLRAR